MLSNNEPYASLYAFVTKSLSLIASSSFFSIEGMSHLMSKCYSFISTDFISAIKGRTGPRHDSISATSDVNCRFLILSLLIV